LPDRAEWRHKLEPNRSCFCIARLALLRHLRRLEQENGRLPSASHRGGERNKRQAKAALNAPGAAVGSGLSQTCARYRKLLAAGRKMTMPPEGGTVDTS